MYYLYMYLYINWLSINERLPENQDTRPSKFDTQSLLKDALLISIHLK